MKVMVIPVITGALGSHQKIGLGTGRFGNKRARGDHPNYNTIKIDQNTEKSPGD